MRSLRIGIYLAMAIAAISLMTGCGKSGEKATDGLYIFDTDGSVEGPYHIRRIERHGEHMLVDLKPGQLYIETDVDLVHNVRACNMAIGLLSRGHCYPCNINAASSRCFVVSIGQEIPKKASDQETFESYLPHLTSSTSQGIPVQVLDLQSLSLEEAVVELYKSNQWGLVLKGISPKILHPNNYGKHGKTLKDWTSKDRLANGMTLYRFQSQSFAEEDKDTCIPIGEGAVCVPFQRGYIYMVYGDPYEEAYKVIAKPKANR